MIQITLNGAGRRFEGEPQMPLLWYLGDVLELTGTKFGCDIGQCGACTVRVNGEAARGCQSVISRRVPCD